jgi:DNA polymerase III subunit beta
MKLSIKTSTLLNSLNKVNRFVSSKSPIESLSGILFAVNNDHLILKGSDANISIETTVDQDINVSEEGSIIIPKFVVEIIRKIEDDIINIELIGDNIIFINSKNSEFKINGLKPEAFPNIDFSTNNQSFTIAAHLFNELVNQTTFATSNEEVRPILTGVNFNYSDDVLTCVATDSFRLAKKIIPDLSTFDFNIVVPAKCLNDIAKLVDEDKMKVYINGQRILFDLGHTKIHSRLINGNYPDTSKLIPNAFENKITLNRNILLNSLERANILSLNSASYIVSLEKTTNQLTLSSKAQEVGSIKEKIALIDESGKDFYISFNSNYMIEALKAFEQNEVELSFNGPMNPFIITEMDDDKLIQLVLPVKTY